jgi:hypothetical protein
MMKTFRAAWCAAVMAAWISGSALAAPPNTEEAVPRASGNKDSTAPGATSPTAGAAQAKADDAGPQQYLLLGNGRVFSGRVEKQNNRYLLRRSGGVIPFPADQVLLLADSIEKVYEFKVQRIAAGDIEEHLKLSEWCTQHKLPAQAEAELVHVLRIEPQNLRAQHRLDSMRRSREPSEKAGAAASKPRSRTQMIAADPSAYLVSFTQAHGRRAFERFSVLELRLLNECGRCHASIQYTGPFRLFGRDRGQSLDQRRTARNLQAVLNNVDYEDPSRSVLLYMALNPHGDLKLPPYAGPNDPHFKDLSDWVHQMGESSRSAVIASDPREEPGERMPTDELPATVPAGQPAERVAKRGLLPGSDITRRAAATPAADDDPDTGSAAKPAPTPNRAGKSRKLRDPYDPAAFNEQFAPAEKNKK